jgi:hypothetical protein
MFEIRAEVTMEIDCELQHTAECQAILELSCVPGVKGVDVRCCTCDEEEPADGTIVVQQ